jgi:hypothetical protein
VVLDAKALFIELKLMLFLPPVWGKTTILLSVLAALHGPLESPLPQDWIRDVKASTDTPAVWKLVSYPLTKVKILLPIRSSADESRPRVPS